MDKPNYTTAKVSILIVTYNAEKYIKKTIQSCLEHTYSNLEVLILDNNSQDETVEIVEGIQKGDSRLKIFKSEENLGPYAGLNFLLDKADGEYIAIQDHDDIWFPEKIEKQVNFLNKNSDFIACGANTFYYYEEKKLLILNKKPAVTDFVDHTSLMFRNKGYRYSHELVLADEFFEKKTLVKNGKIACLQEPLTIHRIKVDGSNLSRSRFKFTFKNLKEFFEVNALSLGSFIYLLDLLLSRILSEKIIWIIRKGITQKGRLWLTSKEFIQKYPTVKF